MAEITRRSGVRINAPEGVTVSDEATLLARRHRSGAADAFTAPAVESLAVERALEKQEFELVDEFDFVPESVPGARARRSVAELHAGREIDVAVDLTGDESAVILIEDEGEYRWQFPALAAPAGRRRRGVRGPASRQATFTIAIQPSAADRVPPMARRGVVERFVWGRVRAYILKFVARTAGKSLLKKLEKNIQAGLVHLTGSTDVAQWHLLDGKAPIKLPAPGTGRVLLLVHGTFSSTAGSFGALTQTDFGQRLLQSMLRNYDAVLAWDHRTLSEDPRENAKAMLARLKKLGWPSDLIFDAVCFSRGGLVLRTLTEELLPNSRWNPKFERVVFVGCTNEGTLFAEPDNWHALVDLYTNLAAGACRGLEFVPGAAPFARVFAEIIKGVGALVKYLATYAIKENGAPGLAAMRPDGPFVTQLNSTQDGQPTANDTYYCAITSDFEASLALQDVTKPGLAPRLLMKLADGLVDRLIGRANDLVVHVDSMTGIDRSVGDFIKDTLNYGENGLVYHTNYFSQANTVSALTTWLRLGAPHSMFASGEERRTIRRAGIDRSAAPVVPPGGTVHSSLGIGVNTNIVVVDDAAPLARVIKAVSMHEADFVVMRRETDDEPYHYALAAEELAEVSRGGDDKLSLSVAIDAHEYTRSHEADLSTDIVLPKPPVSHAPSADRTVILDHGQPVGVVPRSTDLVDAAVAGGARKRGGRRGGGLAQPVRKAHEPGRTRVECFFQAEVDETVTVDVPATIDVAVSRELIDTATREVVVRGRSARVRKDLPIELQVVPKRNFAAARSGGDESDMRRIKVPEPGVVERVTFHLAPSYPGQGEVWVQARQGRLPLVTLKLHTKVVLHAPADRTRKARATVTVASIPDVRKPVDTFRITEHINGSQVRYDFDVELVSLSRPRRFRGYSEPLLVDRQEYIANIYRDIEDRWGHSKASFAAFQRDLQSIGARMFRSLVPLELRNLLWENRHRLKHIQVLSTEPFIPWELAYVTNPAEDVVSKDGRFLGEMGLVRWLYEDFPPQTLRVRKGKSRYVAPDYVQAGDRLAALEEETKVLTKMFGASAVDATADAVYELLSEPGRFDLLHFICHGLADSLHPERAKLQMRGAIVDNEYLEDAVRAGTVETHGNCRSDPGPLIVLNACQSARLGYTLIGIGGFSQAFIRAGAGAFIGTHWSVGDGEALTFITEFYENFKMKRRTLAESVTAAREAAASAGDATWLAYTAYGEPYARLES